MGLRKDYDTDFERLWREYPNKANKLGAFKAWQKHIASEDREELLQHIVERSRYDAQWQRGYIPHLQSFINGARWEDDYKRIPSARYSPKYTEPVSQPAWIERGYESPEAYEEARRAAGSSALESLRRTLH